MHLFTKNKLNISKKKSLNIHHLDIEHSYSIKLKLEKEVKKYMITIKSA